MLQKILVAEQPTIVKSDSEQGGKVPSPEVLFDDNIKVDNSSTQDLVSSHYSNPPLTDSDGFYSEHGNRDSGANDDNQDSVCKHEVTNVKVRKYAHKKKEGHCNDTFQAEGPVVDQSSGKKIKMEKKPITTANSEWPGHAQLVPPPPGKDLHLNDQHVFIQFVVRGAIADVTVQILTNHSFPETDQKLKFQRKTLQNAACHCLSEFLPVVDIYEWIMEDINFSDALGELNPIKTNVMTAIAAYELGLGTGEKCADHITTLFDQEAFIFPGSWGTHPMTGKVVYVVLFEWKSGSQISVKFEGNIFGSI
ncbi:hypothetical protein L208DRAFT_1382538 [Tricholoma matsutake]|nr:hypothetical protein L208DRAFT_1382538 [Tricholoma matsutake 945]